MTYEGEPVSRAKPGEIAAPPAEGDIMAVPVEDMAGEPIGLTIQWESDEWFYAHGVDSFVDLDHNL